MQKKSKIVLTSLNRSEYIRFGASTDFESDHHGSSGAEAIGLFFEREI